MNTTNTNQPLNRGAGVNIGAGLALLIIGLLVGVFGSKHYWQKSATVAMNHSVGQQGAPAITAQPAVDASASVQPQSWDPLKQMSKMQAEIDQVFHRSFPQLYKAADLNAVERQISDTQKQIDQLFERSFPQAVNGAAMNAAEIKPGYSLSMDVRDLRDKYQVCAFLPDTKPSDVKVKLNGDELKVDVANKALEKPTAKNGETAMTEWGNYEEVVRLAGPLKENQMTVQHLPHELVISVPKA